MAYYESREELRKGLERRIGRGVSDSNWKEIKPDRDWHPPYGDAGLDDVHERYKALDVQANGKQGESEEIRWARDQALEAAMYESETNALLFAESEVGKIRWGLRQVFPGTQKQGPPFRTWEDWMLSMVAVIDVFREGRGKSLLRDAGACPTCGRSRPLREDGSYYNDSYSLAWPSRDTPLHIEDGTVYMLDSPEHENYAQIPSDCSDSLALVHLAQGSYLIALILGCTEVQAAAYLCLGHIPVVAPVSVHYNVDSTSRNSLAIPQVNYRWVPANLENELRKQLKTKPTARARIPVVDAKLKAFLARNQDLNWEQLRRKVNKEIPGHYGDAKAFGNYCRRRRLTPKQVLADGKARLKKVS